MNEVSPAIRNYTPLHVLISSEADSLNMDAILFLLDAGANVNALTATIGSPLHLAACWGHTELIDLFVSRGGLLKTKNSRDRTPAEVAVRYDRLDTARHLSEKYNLKVTRGSAARSRASSFFSPLEDPRGLFK